MPANDIDCLLPSSSHSIISRQAFHVLFRIVFAYDSFYFMNAVGFILFSVVNYYGYKLLMYYLVNAHPRSSYGYVLHPA